MMRKLSFPTSSSNASSASATPSTPSLTSSASTAGVNLPSSLSDASQPFPKLIVFDLDYTIWDFWCDTHPTPPFKANAQHSAVTDKMGEEFTYYGAVPSLLHSLPTLCSAHKIRLGVASRTCSPPTARDLLKALHLPPASSLSFSSSSSSLQSSLSLSDSGKKRSSPLIDVFDAGLEIYQGSKIKHLEALHKRTGIAFEDILFFDDEPRNRDTETLGVTMKLVKEGLDWEQVAQGVEEWRGRRKRRMNVSDSRA